MLRKAMMPLPSTQKGAKTNHPLASRPPSAPEASSSTHAGAERGSSGTQTAAERAYQRKRGGAKVRKVEKRYTVEKVVAIRRANDWTAERPRFQYAIQWEGYTEKTWHTPETLDIDAMLLNEMTNELDPSYTWPQVYWDDQQPDGEEEGAVFISP